MIDRALGMPLHREHEVIGGSAFQGFDDAVVGAAGHDAQAIADRVGRLMMRRVYRDDEFVSLLSLAVHDFCQLGIAVNLNCVGYRNLLSGFVIDASCVILPAENPGCAGSAIRRGRR